jgi:positive regulator of sigma E activity
MPPSHSRYALVAEATSAGLLFLLGPAAGYFLGKWIGAALGIGQIPGYVGAALGLVAAFLHLVRLTSRARQ